MNLVFFDLETTGLSPKYASILEIAALIVDDNGNVVSQFHEYINPGRPIPSEIVALTGIRDSEVKNCRREWSVLESFIEWCTGNGIDTMCAHNASFDMRFLRERSSVYKLLNYFNEVAVIDTLPIARRLVKNGKLVTRALSNVEGSKVGGVKQQQIADAFNLNYKAHTALEDAYCLSKIYYKLKQLEG